MIEKWLRGLFRKNDQQTFSETSHQVVKSEEAEQPQPPEIVAPPTTIEAPKELFPGHSEVLAEPVDFLIVHADDEAWQRNSVKRDQAVILDQVVPEGTTEVLSADKWEKLFVFAFQGNAGKPADLVILDDNYRSLGNEWWVTADNFRQLLEKMEHVYPLSLFDFKYRPHQIRDFKDKLSSIGRTLSDEEIAEGDRSENYYPAKLFGTLNSTRFALLLRVLGYAGKIVIFSSDPPSPQELLEKVMQVNQALEIALSFPVDGVVYKQPYQGESTLSVVSNATYEGDMTRSYWQTESLQTVDLSVVLNAMIKQLI